jgi:hypothetical protein
VTDGRLDEAVDLPGDLAVALERADLHGHVVQAEREVVERLTVHVDDELVADGVDAFTGRGHEHP